MCVCVCVNVCVCEMDSPDLGRINVCLHFRHGNETSGFAIVRECVDYPSDYCLKNNSPTLKLFLNKYRY